MRSDSTTIEAAEKMRRWTIFRRARSSRRARTIAQALGASGASGR
jgi:hypothetical protein